MINLMEDETISIYEIENCPDAPAILNNLKEYNVESVGPANRKDLTISVRSSKGAVIGGLIGYTHWEWLFISILWVAEDSRGRNIGSNLVAEAESIAKHRGCRAVHLDTFDFQAPDFYEKLGYKKFGEIFDCPVKGKKRLFYKKEFWE
jgi:ribosomal protein S18 acetylase RimI-like enzyme